MTLTRQIYEYYDSAPGLIRSEEPLAERANAGGTFMKTQEFYHGTAADNIVGILRDGVMRPIDGKIYFVKQESQLHTSFCMDQTPRGARHL